MALQDLSPLLTREKREAVAESVCLELSNGYTQVLKDWVRASFAGENPVVFRIRITMAHGTKFVQRVEHTLQQVSEKNGLPQECLIHILAEKFGLSACPGSSTR